MERLITIGQMHMSGGIRRRFHISAYLDDRSILRSLFMQKLCKSLNLYDVESSALQDRPIQLSAAWPTRAIPCSSRRSGATGIVHHTASHYYKTTNIDMCSNNIDSAIITQLSTAVPFDAHGSLVSAVDCRTGHSPVFCLIFI